MLTNYSTILLTVILIALYMLTYWLFILYPKSSVYLINNLKLEALVSIPTPHYIVMDEIEKHNVLSIIERNKDESVK